MSQNRPVAAGDHVFLVDASAFIFRAYFQSINQNDKYNKRSDGLPTGGVRLFATKLLQFVREGAMGIVPTHLAVIFDKSENSFRKQLFPAYKANRSDPPADLVPQFHLMREAVRAFGLLPVEQDTYEADDLIATYARQAREAGADVTIVSPDKDLMQVVCEGVVMYDPASGMPGAAGARLEKVTRTPEVIEYFGVPPERVVDVQALAGDSTDNVPGAPGIGIKTAAQLIATFGDLDTLLARAHEIKQPKRREALTLPENVERIRISREMVKLCDTVEVAVPLDALRTPRTEGEKLVAFCKALEFTTLMRRIAEFYGVEPGEVEPDERLVGPGGWRTRNGAPAAPIEEGAGIVATGEAPAENRDAAAIAAALPKLDGPAALAAARAAEMRALPFDHARYRTITTLDALDAVIAAAREAGVVAVDTETTSLDARTAELVGVAMAITPGDAVYIPVGHLAPPPPVAPKEPKKGRKDKAAAPAGGLFDAPDAAAAAEVAVEAPPPEQLAVRDVLDRLRPLLEAPDVLKIAQNMKYDWLVFAGHGITVAPFDDTMLMSYVLDAAATTDTHGMDQLAKRHLGHDTIAFKDVAGSGKSFLGFARVPLDRATAYAAEDADVTLRLWRVLKPRLPAERMTAVYEALERPLVPALARMERRGIAIDSQILSRLSGDFAQTMARLESEIHEAAGEPFNLGSPKQLGDILFGKMGLPGAKKTATGAWSTSAQVLDELAETGNGFAKLMLEWRQVSKLKATYTDALPTFADAEGRVHTSFALAATTTGRLSSSDPNIQNIPIRRGRPQDPHRLRVDAGAQAGVGGLFADRAPAAGPYRRYPAAQAGLRRGPGHPRHHGLRDVRRAALRDDRRGPPPRQGHQLRHHLRHLGLRPRQPARHRPPGGGGLHQDLLRAVPRHPRLHGGDQEAGTRPGLRVDPVRAQVPLPAHQRLESVGARLQRARRHQHADPGHGRRHHPARHGADGCRAGVREARRPHAAAGARRTGVRSGRGRGGAGDPGDQARDGGGAPPGRGTVGAARRRGRGRPQLGRGALRSRPGERRRP